MLGREVSHYTFSIAMCNGWTLTILLKRGSFWVASISVRLHSLCDQFNCFNGVFLARIGAALGMMVEVFKQNRQFQRLPHARAS